MPEGFTDKVRAYVEDRYIQPARQAGHVRVSVRVRDVRSEFGKHESMRGQSVAICQALQGKKWLKEAGLEVERIDGPPSGKSPTVVMHYALIPNGTASACTTKAESPERWAELLVGNVKGLLKVELAEYGGAEAFMRWVRSEDKERR